MVILIKKIIAGLMCILLYCLLEKAKISFVFYIYAFPIHLSITVLYKINNFKQIHADVMPFKKNRKIHV